MRNCLIIILLAFFSCSKDEVEPVDQIPKSEGPEYMKEFTSNSWACDDDWWSVTIEFNGDNVKWKEIKKPQNPIERVPIDFNGKYYYQSGTVYMIGEINGHLVSVNQWDNDYNVKTYDGNCSGSFECGKSNSYIVKKSS